MDLFVVASGIVLVAFVLLDVFWTTLAPGAGSGPLTRTTSRAGWWLLRRVARGSALTAVGPLLLVAGVFGWILLLATGWVIAFSGEAGSLLYTREPDTPPADLTGRIWFVVYTMFTVGNGDYTPDGDGYQIAAAATALTGMVLITLTVTYLLNVVSAVVRARSLASDISGLGRSAEEIVLGAWDGSGVPGLDLQLVSISSGVDRLTEDHRAYPLLHYYRAPGRERATEPSIAALDDALTLLDTALASPARPPRSVVTATRSSIGSYLEAVGSVFPPSPLGEPPPPSLERLRRAGVPLALDEPGLAKELAEHADRRRGHRGAVDAKRLPWPSEAT